MYLKAGDVISGQEGWATMTKYNSDGSTELVQLFCIRNIEATCKFNKTGVRTLGKRGEQHKPNGWTGSANATVYYVTSEFRKMALQYIKTGIPVYFDVTIINDDPASTVGKQTTLLRTCSMDEVCMAKLDVDADLLDENITFTFDDVDLLESFVNPVLGN